MYHKLIVAITILCITSVPSFAGGVTYKDGEKYVKLGGRIQMQYHQKDPDSGDSSDDLFFRRLRPFIEGSVHEDWKGKFQFDLGKSNDDNEVSIKDAYMQYSGFENMKVTIGNAFIIPFSREMMTSSKYQQLVERTFVGDHNYGTPDRQLGVSLEGHSDDKNFEWAVGIADGRIDPDAKKLDFDTAVNDASDWNEGAMIGARVNFHPFGHLKMSQGDFSGETKATISAAAFSFSNDGDNNTRTDGGVDTSDGSKPDIDSVTGLELSGAFRSSGISVDAQFNSFSASTVDGNVSQGIYKNGETQLTNYAVEGGYMFNNTFEIVAAFSSQDADGYADPWTRTALGLNWFIHKHDIKFQATYRTNENKDGNNGNNLNEMFVQAQYVF